MVDNYSLKGTTLNSLEFTRNIQERDLESIEDHNGCGKEEAWEFTAWKPVNLVSGNRCGCLDY
jgi:hypothetical protein